LRANSIRLRTAAAVACSLLAVALAPAPVSAQAPAAVSPETLVKQLLGDASSPKRGVLFEVSNGANTIYLFGTLHVGRPDFYPLNAAITRPLAAAGRVWFELDFSDLGALQRMASAGEYTDGTTLDQKLPPALMRRVEAALGRQGTSSGSLHTKKPWAVVAELVMVDAEQLGYSPIFAADIYLATIAQLLGKPISGLESIDEQVAALSAMNDDEQKAEVEAVVATIEDGRSGAELKTLVEAWARGDRTALESAFRATEGDLPPTLRNMKRRLFDERNAKMADKIASILRSGTPSYVAIGAGHLVGAGSVVELLRKQGFTVREL
jgi:uncharacterized protein YbaP (TraB family)